MKKWILSVCFFIMTVALCSCGEKPVEAAPPAPSVMPAPVDYYVTDDSAERILALARKPGLKVIDATQSSEYKALQEIEKLMPDCSITWNYEFDGFVYTNHSQHIIADTLDGISEALDALPHITSVDLTQCEVPDAVKDDLLSRYPDIDFLWYVHFGEWTVRSDITCFSSLRPSFQYNATRYYSSTFAPLFKYCTKLRALDLGHNYINDISLISNLKELRVLILVDASALTDISAISGLTKLQYLELFMLPNKFDFSFLYDMTEMRDLNLCYQPGLKDISFVDNMPKLERFWLRGSPVPIDMIKEYIAKRPDVHFQYACSHPASSTCCGWRANEDNLCVRMAFFNWDRVLNFESMDNITYDQSAYLYFPGPLYD